MRFVPDFDFENLESIQNEPITPSKMSPRLYYKYTLIMDPPKRRTRTTKNEHFVQDKDSLSTRDDKLDFSVSFIDSNVNILEDPENNKESCKDTNGHNSTTMIM